MRKSYKILMDKMFEKKFVLITILIFVGFLILIPLLMSWLPIKQFISFLLSFTDDASYKIAFVELYGAIIGSFIAIYGALWTQRIIDQKEKIKEQKKYAYIVYFDLAFSFNDLKKILDKTKSKYGLDKIEGEKNIKRFCEITLEKKFYLNPNWIIDVPQLCTVLNKEEISLVYRCYGKFMNMENAISSKNLENVKAIYDRHISWLIDEGIEKSDSEVKKLLNKLESLL